MELQFDFRQTVFILVNASLYYMLHVIVYNSVVMISSDVS